MDLSTRASRSRIWASYGSSEVPSAHSAESVLLPIQFAQQEHDQFAHRDILNLDTQTRLKHMTLHFLKYAGKIAHAREEANESELGNILVDVLIICLATANTLNVSIGAAIKPSVDDLNLQSLANTLARGIARETIFDRTLTDLVKIAGRMAKSIESTDHLEDGNPRAELETLIGELSVAMLADCGVLGIPIFATIQQCWKSVEAKSIFTQMERI